MASNTRKEKTPQFICLCNKIPLADIKAAISRGCNTLNKIAAATTAGAGQCGGSCQPNIQKILEKCTSDLSSAKTYVKNVDE